MKTLAKPARLAIVLLLLVLVPALMFTVYELTSLSTTEQLLDEIYTRQLDAILFSVNQHAWDVVNSWANTVAQNVEGRPDSVLPLLGAQASAISALFFADSLGRILHLSRTAGNSEMLPADSVDLAGTLSRQSGHFQRLARYVKSGYRKLEPIGAEDFRRNHQDVIVAFALADQQEISAAGFVIRADAFIRIVIAPKLLDVAGNEFVLGVLSKGNREPVVNTSPVTAAELKQQRALWLFPDHSLGIRLKGTTVADIVRERTTQNTVLIIILNLVVITGAWLLYRTVRHEMELVRLKSDFVSNVSHELRTPLALIRMFAETLEMGRLRSEEKKTEYYGTIVKESERLTRLVNNILDFSRMEAGKKQYTFGQTDINTVVGSVLNTYSYHLQNHGIEPLVRLADGLPVITADSEAVTEAVINLIDNAIKYSKEEKFLRIETKMVASGIAVEVEDHGAGIAPEHQKKIFDTFYRVSEGLVHNTKGSGLGLSLVKHIMDAHGGKVELDSTIGKGSTFRLVFPNKHLRKKT
ncbi:MAG: hypothetical protein KF749_00700 [Bacteroidetes bacterium]|nr:hypothetical protein [Bacteroidota bacterium]MCW5895147.1 hypothetical protein [Bacteroidota bacterium]